MPRVVRVISAAFALAANIGGATLCFRSLFASCVDMIMLLRSVTRSTRRPNDGRAPRDEQARPSRTRVRSWTGRSAMSRSTDSPVPSFVTAGARKTRVSEMRHLPRARRLHLNMESADSATATPECRNRGVNEHQHRWSG